MSRKIYTILSLLIVAAFVLSACGAPATEAPQTEPAAPAATEPPAAATEAPAATEPPASEPVTVTWWHITTDEKQAAVWQSLADSYMAEHPNVNIEITILENEAFKTKMTTVVQSGDMPDIFQSWGGGVMNEYIGAGMMKDITADLDADGGAWRNTFSPGALGVYSLDGKNYGVPWDMGMVGFWYNKDLFAQAGIDAPPATWDELLDTVTKLKAAGITPIALGEGDKWPGHFWFGYLATRICGQNGFQAAASRSGSFADTCFVEAGNKILELNALEPFQDGYLGAVYGDQSTVMGNGQAAMELMGQWAPGAQAGNSADGKGLGDKLGFFPFPAVDGGAGAGTDAFGGGNGFGIGKDAEPEAVDFVKWLTSADAQVACAEAGFCIPVVKGGEAGMSDPLLIELQKTLSQAEYFQLYYDQALPPAVGSVVNDSIQGVFAGTLSPEEAAQAIEDSAAQEIK
ncbi:MAG TPA: extracellular solute-binding protein [Anaerolineales bacterium]|nr:extracellular solute-binding protein [Anaerolineales bacterium]